MIELQGLPFPQPESERLFAEAVIDELVLLCPPATKDNFRVESLQKGSIRAVIGVIGSIALQAARMTASVLALLPGAIVVGAWIIRHHLERIWALARGVNVAQLPLVLAHGQLNLNPPPDIILGRPHLPRILGLDGGGTRGLVQLAMLKKLEERLRARPGLEHAHVAQVFDWIVGTSTGGLIGVALRVGQQMRANNAQGPTVDSLAAGYRNFAETVFPKGFLAWLKGAGSMLLGANAWYSAVPLEQILDQEYQGQTAFGTLRGVAVTTRDLSNGQSLLVTSQHHPNLLLRWVCRFTSAAPGYLPVVTHQGITYADGGIGANCPLALFLQRLQVPAGQRPVVVSFGTGAPPNGQPLPGEPGAPSLFYLTLVVMRNLLDNATDTELCADVAATITQQRNGTFIRVQPRLLAAIPLDASDPASLATLHNTQWPTHNSNGTPALTPGQVLARLLPPVWP